MMKRLDGLQGNKQDANRVQASDGGGVDFM